MLPKTLSIHALLKIKIIVPISAVMDQDSIGPCIMYVHHLLVRGLQLLISLPVAITALILFSLPASSCLYLCPNRHHACAQ